MQPQQQQPDDIVPGPANQYDFIVNPPQKQPPKSGLPNLGGGGGGSLLNKKLLIFAGGGLGLILLLIMIFLIFSGGNPDVDRAVGITQTQQELIRVSEQGSEAIEQQLKNSAISTQLTLTTQQLQWKSILSKEGHELDDKTLVAKLNSDTDEQLETARQSATFDSAFSQILDTELRSYAAELNQVFTETDDSSIRELASTHFKQLELLVKQLPGEQQ